jgi:predicted esterase
MKLPEAQRGLTRVSVSLASLALIAALALAACGGSSTTAPTSPSAAPSTAVAASPSPSWSPTASPAPIPVVKPGEKLPPFSELKAMFAYNASQPLGLETTPAEAQPGCSVDAVWFDVGDDQATGYLVTPQGEGPFPVVVYAPGWQTDVVMFMDDAVALAQEGYAGLLLQEPAWATYWSFDPRADCEAVVQTVTQARRGLDLLATLPQIDAQRIGFVGWSNGAHLCGGVLAGVDERIKAYVLIGMARPVTNYRGLSGLPKGAKGDQVAAELALWDPVNYLGRNRGAAFLLLSGKGDSNAVQDAKAFLAAAPKPKTWRVYSGGHSATPAANKFWQAWMLKNL